VDTAVTKKSPEQLRSGDFFAYIQWFATSWELSRKEAQ
jgi:hypothetical protein